MYYVQIEPGRMVMKAKDTAEVEITTIQVRFQSWLSDALQSTLCSYLKYKLTILYNLDYRGRYWRGGGSFAPPGFRGGGPPNYYNPRDPRQGARMYYRGGMQQHAGPGGYQPRPYMRPRFHPYARGGGGGWADDH